MHTGAMASRVFGRDRELATVQAQTSGIVVLAGDSGVGKSTMLASLSHPWRRGVLVGAPVVLRSIQGSLQAAIAEALGDCLHQFTVDNPQDAREIWATLKATAGRLAAATGRHGGELVVARAFEFVESKLGKDASKVLRGVLSEVLTPDSARLEDRLGALVLPDTAADLVEIANEVARHTESQVVVLLDAGERLTAEDRGLLAEVASALRGCPIVVVVCVNSSIVEGADLVRLVEARDADVLRVGAMSWEHIYEWLESENVPQVSWNYIAHASSGYPLFISLAIGLVHSGSVVNIAQIPPSFRALLEAGWRSLEPGLQKVATRLAVFADPPSDEFLQSYLGLDVLEWPIVRRRLLENGAFVKRADGQEWFHERRRYHLWNELLSDSERYAVSSEAIESIRTRLESTGVIERWVTPALPIVGRNTRPSGENKYLRALFALGDDELAILWSLLEVVEPNGERGEFAETVELVRYASMRAGFTGDPLAAIENLVRHEMAYTAANDHSAIICPVLPDAFAKAALIGEIEHRFGVSVSPRFASSAFGAFIRPDMGPFDQAQISLGEGTRANHVAALDGLVKSGDTFRLRTRIHGLAVDIDVDGIPVTSTVLFESDEHRDSARDRVFKRHESGRVGRVRLRSLEILPPTRVRYGRYRDILMGLASMVPGPEFSGPQEIIEWRTHVSSILEIVRAELGDRDASALGLGCGFRYLVDASRWPAGFAEYEVTGSAVGGASIIDDAEGILPLDPLLELKLRSRGLLSPAERLTRTSVRSGSALGSSSPFVVVAEMLQERGRRFNRRLPPVLISLDESELARQIAGERRAAEGLEAAIRSAGFPSGKAAGCSIVVLLCEMTDAAAWFRWSATSYEVLDGRGETEVRILREYDSRRTWEDAPGYLRSLGLACPDNSLSRIHDGEASAVLAPLLGYDDEDVLMGSRE